MESKPVQFDDNPVIKEQLGDIKFASMTVRLFKIPSLQTGPNLDLGQTATYKGGIEDLEAEFKFDEFYTLPKDVPVSVCSNTAEILQILISKNENADDG